MVVAFLRIIEISTQNKNGFSVEEDIQFNMLLHEIVHAVLMDGGYYRYSEDEPFVEWVSKNL